MKIVDDTDRDPVVWEIEQKRERKREIVFIFIFISLSPVYFCLVQLFQFFSLSFVVKNRKDGWIKKKKKNEEEAIFSVDRYQDQSWSMS